jgi:hypothetical protein
MKKPFALFASLLFFIATTFAQTDIHVWEKYELKGDSAYIFSAKTPMLNLVPLANKEPLKLIDRQT